MMNNNVTLVPESYRSAAPLKQQGTLTDISYRVNNYINPSRQLVVNQNISSQEAGREAVDGLAEAAGNHLGEYYRVLVRNGKHDHDVWYNGVYNYCRLCFVNRYEQQRTYEIIL